MSKIQGWIYKITNLINGKIYVGQTKRSSINKRWGRHKYDLNRNTHNNKHLQSAWNKYGEPNFKFEVVEKFNSEMNFDLNNLEKYWIKQFDSMNRDKGYNKTSGGDNKTLSQETKNKLKGKHNSVSTEFKKGIRYSPDTEFKPGATPIAPFKKGHKPWNQTQIKCLNNNKIYNSQQEAAMELNIDRKHISCVCNGKRNHTFGFKFEYIGEKHV